MKKKSKLKKFFFWVAVLLVFFLGAAFFGAAYLLNGIDRGDGTFDDSNLSANESLPGGALNIAVFGVDSREDDVTGRSDAMMIVSVDTDHHKIKAVSIMRDSLVPIEGYGKKKINSAYALGGAELAIKTLNQCFDMNIKDYVSVNFGQLAGIVDALGGVEVDITKAERDESNKFIREMAKEGGFEPDLIQDWGEVTLYGYQAVSYSRIRHVGNADFERTERQREVMGKLMDKALGASVLRYPSIISNLMPMVETSLSNTEIAKIAASMLLRGKPEFEQGRFPIDGEYKTNSSYAMVYNLDEAAEKLHRFIYDDEPFYDEEE